MPTDPVEKIRTPHKLGRLLIAPSYTPGDPDSHSVDCPFPFRHEGRYRMLLNCFDGIGYRTVLASSDDLLSWRRDGLLADRGPAGSETEFNAAIPAVLRDPELTGDGEATPVDGMLIGAWHGYPDRGQERGRGYIGIARGESLRRWRFGPVCLRADNGAAWERGGLYKPCLVAAGGRYWCFYNAKQRLDWPWQEQIGVAFSEDLERWTRHAANPVVPVGGPGEPDELFAADPFVLRADGAWVMFYYGLAADGHARELAAFSDDLLTWRKAGEILIDVGPEGSIDSQYAHKPGVIAREGVLYHFYGASRRKAPGEADAVGAKDRRGIALATSKPLAGR